MKAPGPAFDWAAVNLSDVLICVAFMAKDGEPCFMCLLDIWASTFENCSTHLHIY
jgi:hypothetical protein